MTYIQTAAAGGLSPIRIDNANSYADVVSIGIAIANSGVPRSDIFLLSKVGNGFAMGYNDTLQRAGGGGEKAGGWASDPPSIPPPAMQRWRPFSRRRV